MEASEIAAWWGATVATMVLLWDVFKWKRSGPILTMSATPNMRIVDGRNQDKRSNLMISVRVTNVGNQTTTITQLHGVHYACYFDKVRNKRNKAFIVANPMITQPLPHVLSPGEQWTGVMEQSPEVVSLSREGYLYCGVCYSSRKKPAMRRLVIPEEKVDS